MSHHDVDPVILEAVHSVANRFGAPGLEDLIRVAGSELDSAKAALADLAESDSDPG